MSQCMSLSDIGLISNKAVKRVHASVHCSRNNCELQSLFWISDIKFLSTILRHTFRPQCYLKGFTGVVWTGARSTKTRETRDLPPKPKGGAINYWVFLRQIKTVFFVSGLDIGLDIFKCVFITMSLSVSLLIILSHVRHVLQVDMQCPLVRGKGYVHCAALVWRAHWQQ